PELNLLPDDGMVNVDKHNATRVVGRMRLPGREHPWLYSAVANELVVGDAPGDIALNGWHITRSLASGWPSSSPTIVWLDNVRPWSRWYVRLLDRIGSSRCRRHGIITIRMSAELDDTPTRPETLSEPVAPRLVSESTILTSAGRTECI